MPLTPQEKIFCDHLDYENCHCPSQEMPVPACNWMTAHRLQQMDIWNILMLRRWERKDVMLPEKPSEPYAPVWKTADEARRRNQELAEEVEEAEKRFQEHLKALRRSRELAKEAEDAKRTGRTPLGDE